MGFRTGSYATVWEVNPTKSDKVTRVRMSTSRKSRDGEGYEDDFSSYTSFIGACAKDALSLKKLDRIKLGDVDVRGGYDKEKGYAVFDLNVFSFEKVERNGSSNNNAPKQSSNNSDLEAIDEEDVPF